MKINLFKSVLAASIAAATLASCQSEPEVGSLLYPTPEENYSAKAYLFTGTSEGSKLSLSAVKSASTVTLNGDSAMVYVRLSSPVEKDVTVTVAATSENVTPTGAEEVMGADAISLSRTTVTIPKGQQIAAEPIVVKLVNGDALKNLTMLKNGVTSVVIKSVDGVALASTSTKVLVATNFSFDNINPSGTLDADKQVELADYTMSTSLEGTDATVLNDGDNDTYVYQYIYYEPEFTMSFRNAKTLSGISVLCNYTASGYGVKQLLVAVSMDGKTWLNMGTASTDTSYDDNTPFPVVFSTPVTCRYVRIKVLDTFDNSEYPRFLIGEIGAYE